VLLGSRIGPDVHEGSQHSFVAVLVQQVQQLYIIGLACLLVMQAMIFESSWLRGTGSDGWSQCGWLSPVFDNIDTGAFLSILRLWTQYQLPWKQYNCGLSTGSEMYMDVLKRCAPPDESEGVVICRTPH
jgi:hypothetical protein